MRSMSPEKVQIFIAYINSQIEIEDHNRNEAKSNNRYELAYYAKLEGARLRQTLEAFLRILDSNNP